MFLQLGQPDDRLGLDVLAGAAGDVVDAMRQAGFLGEHAEVVVKAFLRRLVVVGGDLQGGVGADFFGELRQAEGFGRAVRAGAGHDLDSAGDGLDDEGDDALLFLVAERGRLAGGAHRDEAVGAGGDLELDLRLAVFRSRRRPP